MRDGRSLGIAGVVNRAALFAVAALATWGALAAGRRLAAADATGVIEGSVVVAERLRGRTGAVLVTLEPQDGKPVPNAPSPGRATIGQRGAKFEPTFLHLPAGATLDFVNDEPNDLEHNVFSFSDAKTFDLGLFGRGGRKSIVFEKAGEVTMFCSIHKLMEATVYVTPTPWRAVVDDATGRFKIERVPAGRWRAKTWVATKRCPNVSAEVDLPAGETAKLELSLGKRGP